jgi:hypothetical protein
MQDRKAMLSTLWIFLSVNYIYCDHLENMQPGAIKELLTGQIGAIQVTPVFLLTAALLLEIPFVMIVLSRVLRYRANRWANIVAGILMTVVQVGTMGMVSIAARCLPPMIGLVFTTGASAAGLRKRLRAGLRASSVGSPRSPFCGCAGGSWHRG